MFLNMYTKLRNKLRLRSRIRKRWGELSRCIRLKYWENRFRGKCAFLFGVPGHSNLGDQAQTYCILRHLRKYLKGYRIYTFTLSDATEELLQTIRRVYRPGDRLFCHSGYHMTDRYHEIDPYLRLAELFPEAPLCILPQTFYFEKEEAAKRAAHILNAHGNVTLLCRDKVSYEYAKGLFHGCRLILYPDIVTSLIGEIKLQEMVREGVYLCIRNDCESRYTKAEIQNLSDELSGLCPVSRGDTTIPLPHEYISHHREEVLMHTFKELSRYRAVVTDRYHGTIFALIANTPVIVINSADHKLSSGVAWFPEEFRSHVYFVDDINAVPALIKQIIQSPPPQKLPRYFAEKYYGESFSDILNLREENR